MPVKQGIGTFLEYFHATKMCHLSIPLGQIRLGADQKRFFISTTLMFILFYSNGKGANSYNLAVYNDTCIIDNGKLCFMEVFMLK